MNKLYRMTHVRPLGRAIPVDEELLASLGERRKEIAVFSDWQREPDYPLPIEPELADMLQEVDDITKAALDVWELDRQAMLRAMQRRYQWDKLAVWGGTILFCAAAWVGIIWLVLKAADWLDAL